MKHVAQGLREKHIARNAVQARETRSSAYGSDAATRYRGVMS
ncbi:hypothetical protein BIFPSEUDO_04344 [Bifidobacterium pseudocatenulatum DSM 20438 = JCM 1200 = LMG 10505]|uniref:Uncharacterized protein n=1 Tax=Bifidobacterium pseudocatenulatum DSM 20438 = JCM 1200 = LMG 10505 TaxID=547043 RepID=C0BVA0_BIFPS|nr:hypothetical protein BIFPSEUDO_04344 [Bifidobacterium pseudocatenulatum DSM 20438 = JCM 1200 = LMG 10505]